MGRPLPEGLTAVPADSTTIVVLGSDPRGRLHALCAAVGRQLAQSGYSLVTGGTSSVRAPVAEAFAAEARDTQRLTFLVRDAKDHRCAMGLVERVHPDRQEARRTLVGRASAGLVIGGGTGTRREASLALEQDLPLVPVPVTGGAARELARSLGGDWSRDLPPDLLHQLLDPDLSPDALARAAVSALGYVLAAKKPGARAAPRLEQTRLLLLASNPSDTAQLRLAEERREIERILQSSRYADRFQLIDAPATRAADLQRLLREHEPHVVHFCGHGGERGEVVLEDARGQSQPVSAQVLAELFAHQPVLQGVLLNACLSAEQAEAIARRVPWVIGMETAIADSHAVAFAGAFYLALGSGAPVAAAFDSGKLQLRLEFGLKDTPPRLIQNGTPPDLQPPGPRPQDGGRTPVARNDLPCAGRPEHLLAGGATVYVGTDAGEWFATARHSQVHTLQPLPTVSCAALDGGGALALGSFAGMVARSAQHRWDFVPCEAPVLALAPVTDGLALGDASGRILALSSSAAPALVRELPSAVTQLLAPGGHLVALCAGGRVTAFPQVGHGELVTVDPGEVGAAFLLFPTEDEQRFGLAGATRAALVDATTGRVEATSPPMEDGIRAVVPLIGHPEGYVALTDEGELFLMDAQLAVTRLRLPRHAAAVVGLAPLRQRGLLAWTRTGQLFRIDRTRAVSQVAESGVLLAAQAPGTSGRLVMVRSEGNETRVEWDAGVAG